MNPGKLTWIVVLAAAVGLLALWLGSGDGAAPRQAGPAGSGADLPAATPLEAPVGTAPDPATARTRVPDPALANAGPHGCTGRVVDAAGTPVAGAVVTLVEGHGDDPLAAAVLERRGIVVPPVARTTSDGGGRFELRVRRVASGGYELRVDSAVHAGGRVPNVTLFDGRVVDLGDVRLPPGTTLAGRVVAEGTDGFPIAGAVVRAVRAGILPTLVTGEQGLEVRTDATGHYRIDGIGPGFVRVSAAADGFARLEQPLVDVRPDGTTRADFALPRGLSIRGVVTDRDGGPLAGARVVATRLEARQPMQTTATAGADGAFELPALREGPYAVTASAPGHVATEHKPIAAGAADERFALFRQGAAAVRVADRHGRPVARYELIVRGHDPHSGALARLPEAPIEPVLPVDLDDDGRYPVRHLDPGSYVLEVQADDHAKTFSAPFAIALDAPPVPVDVVLAAGGTVEGVVVDDAGRPVEGAEVATLPAALDDSPLARLVQGLVPQRETSAVATTDAAGRYRLEHLAPGSYRLRLSREGLCTAWLGELAIADGAVERLPDAVLLRGAVVTGTVRVDGVPAGQVKVTLRSLEPGAPALDAAAVTDDAGRFVLAAPIPPGRYEAQAARQNLATPILQIADFHATRREIVVAPGQEHLELHFDIRSG